MSPSADTMGESEESMADVVVEDGEKSPRSQVESKGRKYTRNFN